MKITDNAEDQNLKVIGIVLYSRLGLGIFEETGVWLRDLYHT